MILRPELSRMHLHPQIHIPNAFPAFEKIEIKVVWMSSNFKRFPAIINQAKYQLFISCGTSKSARIPQTKMIWSFFRKLFLKKNYLAASKDGQLSPDKKQTGWLKNPGHVAFRVWLLTIGCPTLAFWSRWNLDINWRVQQLVCKKIHM